MPDEVNQLHAPKAEPVTIARWIEACAFVERLSAEVEGATPTGAMHPVSEGYADLLGIFRGLTERPPVLFEPMPLRANRPPRVSVRLFGPDGRECYSSQVHAIFRMTQREWDRAIPAPAPKVMEFPPRPQAPDLVINIDVTEGIPKELWPGDDFRDELLTCLRAWAKKLAETVETSGVGPVCDTSLDDKDLEILQCLSVARRPMKLTQISKAVRLNRDRVSDKCGAMRIKGYLERKSPRRGYFITPRGQRLLKDLRREHPTLSQTPWAGHRHDKPLH